MQSDPILVEADRCVKCGYCLPHCPTYVLTRDEGESPRGRIALLQALASGTLDTPRLHAHLDHCLACRGCERVCPSGVRYGALITAGRALQHKRRGGVRRWVSERLAGLVAGAPSHPRFFKLLELYRDSPLHGLVRRFAPERLALLDGLIPDGPLGFLAGGIHRPLGEPVARVGLFTGCVGQLADRKVLEAAIRVLVRLGVEVRVPVAQVCCGALHHHAGMAVESQSLAARNRDAFGGIPLDAILGVSSGCGAHLAEHAALPVPYVEISRYLDQLRWPDGLELRPLERRVLLHTPCSMRLLPGGGSAAGRLLGRIPCLKVEPLADDGLCCGGAGGYLLTQPQLAERLRAPHLAAIAASGADLLLTSNSGCNLHLAAGIRAAGLQVEVLHPVELLARQMEM